MKEGEVDEWYEEEKQKTFDRYVENIEKNKDKEEIEKEYKESMKKNRERYMDLYEKSKTPSIVQKYSKRVRDFIDKLIAIYK